ncbi:DMT family transporter [Enterovibrio sp. ZSDZ35]|uniref:DMT family transporter n=1 Tax=Enterovibrio qingdaonensis TaxID=2899818 RepID=A0ABT5QKW8_9GAMM|nr:DMT family transporter [Enterovibrio sp. ZSDZ35]MDD1780946.1 DMT family transporter [Enterovibrio sp. ZSDZ35]
MMGIWMVLAAALGFSSNPLLAQLLLSQGFSPDSITLYRFAIPTFVMLLLLKKRPVLDGEFLRFIAVGGLSALGMLAFMSSLTKLEPSAVILTYYAYPMFAIVIGWLCFNKAMSRNRMIAAMLIAIAVGIMQESQDFGASWDELMLCLAAPMSFALVINMFSLPEKNHDTSARMFAALLGHMVILVPITLLSGSPLSIPTSVDQLWLILALGILSAALPQYLFSRGAQLADMEQTTMISSCEVVFALGLAWIFLGDAMSQRDVMATALILLAGLIRYEGIPHPRRDDGNTTVSEKALPTQHAEEPTR